MRTLKSQQLLAGLIAAAVSAAVAQPSAAPSTAAQTIVVTGAVESRALDQAPFAASVIGRLNLPLVHEGDAAFHIARVDDPDAVAKELERMRERISAARPGLAGEMPIV